MRCPACLPPVRVCVPLCFFVFPLRFLGDDHYKQHTSKVSSHGCFARVTSKARPHCCRGQGETGALRNKQKVHKKKKTCRRGHAWFQNYFRGYAQDSRRPVVGRAAHLAFGSSGDKAEEYGLGEWAVAAWIRGRACFGERRSLLPGDQRCVFLDSVALARGGARSMQPLYSGVRSTQRTTTVMYTGLEHPPG